MYNALKDTPKTDFVNPGIVIPPEPVIIQEIEKVSQQTINPTLNSEEEKLIKKRKEREEKRKRKLLKDGLINNKNPSEVREEIENQDNISNAAIKRKSTKDRMRDILKN